MNDPVNPKHYNGTVALECIKASLSLDGYRGFLKGNCEKYLFRYEDKNGIEDLRKCQWYLERLIAALEEEQPYAYMASGCPDGFCPMPNVRQGPAVMFDPAD